MPPPRDESGPPATVPVRPRPAPEDPHALPLEFRGLIADLQGEDAARRRDAAVLLANMGLESAGRPLVRAYMASGDEELRSALRHYGTHLSAYVLREVAEPAVGAQSLARLMRLLGDSAAEAGTEVVRAHTRHPSLAVHADASAALARLGDHAGIDLLRKDLDSPDSERRLTAMVALAGLEDPVAAEARRAHVRRYLGGSGAVPDEVGVHAPLLIDPEPDLARLLADLLPEIDEHLVLAVGPASGGISERHRRTVVASTPGWRHVFTTPRHSTDEQMTALRLARDAARREAARSDSAPVLLLGPVPVPSGDPPRWHLLTWLPSDVYRVRVIMLGPNDYGSVIAWWHYIADTAEVPVQLDVVVDLITLDAQRMTAEERLLHRWLEPADRERFARAMLSRL